MSEPHRLSVERIEQAASVIDPVFLNSPQFRAETLERQLECRLVVKVETLNPIRSFKGEVTPYSETNNWTINPIHVESVRDHSSK